MKIPARAIPDNAETREFPDAALVAYCYDSARGPAYIAYKGRQRKAIEHYAFADSERRDAFLAKTVRREAERESAVRARRNASHGLAVGDILYCTWGYEQTNVDFYQVVRVPSERSAVVRRLEADTTHNDHAMTGVTVPRPNVFQERAPEMLRRAVGEGQLSGGDRFALLSKWDGRPRQITTYA